MSYSIAREAQSDTRATRFDRILLGYAGDVHIGQPMKVSSCPSVRARDGLLERWREKTARWAPR